MGDLFVTSTPVGKGVVLVAKTLSMTTTDVELLLGVLGFDSYKDDFSSERFLTGGGKCRTEWVWFTFFLLLLAMTGLFFMVSQFVTLQELEGMFSDRLMASLYPLAATTPDLAETIVGSSFLQGDVNYWALRNAILSLVNGVSSFLGFAFGGLVEASAVRFLLFGFTADLIQTGLRRTVGLVARRPLAAEFVLKKTIIRLWKFSSYICETLLNWREANAQTASQAIVLFAEFSAQSQEANQYSLTRSIPHVHSLLSDLARPGVGIVAPSAQ